MKAAVLALLCLLFVISAADNTHPTSDPHTTPGASTNHTPDSTHHQGHDYQCKPHALNETDKAKILKLINELRSNTAGGHNGHLPKASNMKQVRWDHILEDEAHSWASNCSAFNSPHSRRRENRTHVVKELIFISTGCNAYSESHWDKAFLQWTHGNANAPIALVNNYTYSATRKDADRAFSLLNWANTDLIGCGFANLESLSHTPVHKQFIICHFAEGGNQIGQPVYKTGEPASACPTNFTKSATYPNLCDNHTTIVVPQNPFSHSNTSDQGNDTVVTNCTGYALSPADRDNLVNTLNKERSAIATGAYLNAKNPTIRKDGFPKAGNMRALVWDESLATKARESVSYCKPTTSENKAKFKVSEILFAQSSNNTFPPEPQWKTAAAYWISRKEGVRGEWLTKFDFGTSVSDREASTYTQVIWADSETIGCAFANQEDIWTSRFSKQITRALHIQYIICYFTNPGDLKGSTVYAQEEPCKSCPAAHTCDPKEGLCKKASSV